ncbi:MAG TPA: transposase family protein, partial [Phycisphaerae bacterium]|nr:transposase family protein [Phycisphaerae bacterium]
MSTSLLYHAFGVRGYHYQSTKYAGGAVTFTITQPREGYRCAVCGSANVIGKGKHPRRFRTLPIGGKPVYLGLDVPRVECRQCGAVRQVRIGFADPRVSYTRAFERY